MLYRSRSATAAALNTFRPSTTLSSHAQALSRPLSSAATPQSSTQPPTGQSAGPARATSQRMTVSGSVPSCIARNRAGPVCAATRARSASRPAPGTLQLGELVGGLLACPRGGLAALGLVGRHGEGRLGLHVRDGVGELALLGLNGGDPAGCSAILASRPPSRSRGDSR